MDEALAKKLQEDEELQHKRQMEQVMEAENRLEKLRQEEKERQLAEEFERMQRQLSEELKQQMELNYQQKIQGIHQGTRKKQTTETQRILELSQRNPMKEGYEASVSKDQLICWRCGEVGHRKKDCMKALFCTNCGRNGHTTNKCRQLLRETCTYCSKMDHTEEYCPSRQLDNLRQDFTKPPLFFRSRTPMLVGQYPLDNQTRGWQVRYEKHPTTQPTLGAPGTEGHDASTPNQYQWRKLLTAKEVSDQFTLYSRR